MNTIVKLPEGGPSAACDVKDLVRYFQSRAMTYIVIGAQKDILAKHKKRYSLDYWLRVNCTERSDTMQATTEMVDLLVGTGLFCRDDEVLDPCTGRLVKGLRLSGHDAAALLAP